MAIDNVRIGNDQNFDAEVLQSGLPVLVVFNATWCGPCKTLAPVVANLSLDFENRVRVVAIDIDASPATAARFAIRSVPISMVFRGGAKVTQYAGVATREKLIQLLGI